MHDVHSNACWLFFVEERVFPETSEVDPRHLSIDMIEGWRTVMSSARNVGWDRARGEKGVANNVMECRTLLRIWREDFLNKLASIQ